MGAARGLRFDSLRSFTPPILFGYQAETAFKNSIAASLALFTACGPPALGSILWFSYTSYTLTYQMLKWRFRQGVDTFNVIYINPVSSLSQKFHPFGTRVMDLSSKHLMLGWRNFLCSNPLCMSTTYQ